MLRKTAILRNLLERPGIIVTPGVNNALQAKIVEKVGFDLAYMTGYGTSLSYLGLPDMGILTGTEMVRNAEYIANAINIPLIADADTGYGNAINVMRSVRAYERAGVAGIHIEDQVTPKRCGHLVGKEIISMDEAVGKIRAAVDVREDDDFVIIARTDVMGTIGGSLDEAIKRGKAYAEAGADMIFSEFNSTSIIEPKKFAKEIHKDYPTMKLFFNYSSSFKWYHSPIKFSQIEDIGYKLLIISLGSVRASMKGVWDYAERLKMEGEQAEIIFEKELIGHPTENFHEFSGFSELKKLEEKYLPS